ncbi:hypothetical protein BDY19DRAFT_995381 [Irpex rosettiformis]|uniref:Uncharacterized protein n=1 Tax=Irpex rosettiformis TaxID=378272 RepID=A0ACB8TYC4_9APHY|nr:hypothetical protein BDY19DRAFT_995381 [Irpex rosettiformis]
MDFLRKLRRSSVDVPSTPTAPKIGRIPLPEINSPVVAKSLLAHADEDVIAVDRYPSPSSPLSHTPRHRTGSIVSRSTTPLYMARSTTPSHPTPSPELYAPTPKWQNQRTLLDHDWSSCSPTPDPQSLKERSHTLYTPSPVPRASSSRHQYDRHDTESPEDLKKHLKHRSASQVQPPPPPRSSSRYSKRASVETPDVESVKRPLKGILKTAPPKSARSESTELHWQLLPYDEIRCRKKLYFDVAMPPDLIRDHTRLPPVALHPSDTDKWATSQDGLTQMIIKCSLLPQWDVVVQNDQGVRCRDVFEAIHRSLNLRLTEYEKRSLIHDHERTKVQESFEKRCRDVPMLDHVARREGLLRVDLLKGQRIFMGLTRPPDGGEYWWLHLGLPKAD